MLLSPAVACEASERRTQVLHCERADGSRDLGCACGVEGEAHDVPGANRVLHREPAGVEDVACGCVDDDGDTVSHIAYVALVFRGVEVGQVARERRCHGWGHVGVDATEGVEVEEVGYVGQADLPGAAPDASDACVG